MITPATAAAMITSATAASTSLPPPPPGPAPRQPPTLPTASPVHSAAVQQGSISPDPSRGEASMLFSSPTDTAHRARGSPPSHRSPPSAPIPGLEEDHSTQLSVGSSVQARPSPMLSALLQSARGRGDPAADEGDDTASVRSMFSSVSRPGLSRFAAGSVAAGSVGGLSSGRYAGLYSSHSPVSQPLPRAAAAQMRSPEAALGPLVSRMLAQSPPVDTGSARAQLNPRTLAALERGSAAPANHRPEESAAHDDDATPSDAGMSLFSGTASQ